jgi:hypothetical protein
MRCVFRDGKERMVFFSLTPGRLTDILPHINDDYRNDLSVAHRRIIVRQKIDGMLQLTNVK